MDARRPWLRVGKRLEITIAIIAVASFLVWSFLSTRNAPSEIHWIIWILIAGFVFPFCFASFLALSWLRRRQNTADPAKKASGPTAGTRALSYLVLLVVTTFSALKQTSVLRGRLAPEQIFLLNFALLAAVVALGEFFSPASSGIGGSD
jgi:Na+/proline symporter